MSINDASQVNLESQENGVFFVGDLPVGTYYVHETSAPAGYSGNKWFKLIIDMDGQSMVAEDEQNSAAEFD